MPTDAVYSPGIHYERGKCPPPGPDRVHLQRPLGFISLRQSLNNAEVLAVAYEYTLEGDLSGGHAEPGRICGPGALLLKMLKSSVTRVELENGEPAPLWDLMMKNVYSLQAFGLSSEDFRIGVWYNDLSTGVDLNYIPGPRSRRVAHPGAGHGPHRHQWPTPAGWRL